MVTRVPPKPAKVEEKSGKNDGYVNLVGASRIANIGATAIRYWILTGRLKAEKDGGRWKIKVEDVLRADEEARQNPRGGLRGKRGRLIREESSPDTD